MWGIEAFSGRNRLRNQEQASFCPWWMYFKIMMAFCLYPAHASHGCCFLVFSLMFDITKRYRPIVQFYIWTSRSLPRYINGQYALKLLAYLFSSIRLASDTGTLFLPDIKPSTSPSNNSNSTDAFRIMGRKEDNTLFWMYVLSCFAT